MTDVEPVEGVLLTSRPDYVTRWFQVCVLLALLAALWLLAGISESVSERVRVDVECGANTNCEVVP